MWRRAAFLRSRRGDYCADREIDLLCRTKQLFACSARRPYNLYCVGADVKPCSISINACSACWRCWQIGLLSRCNFNPRELDAVAVEFWSIVERVAASDRPTAAWTFGTLPKPRNIFGRKRILAESHSQFDRKRNLLLLTVQIVVLNRNRNRITADLYWRASNITANMCTGKPTNFKPAEFLG